MMKTSIGELTILGVSCVKWTGRGSLLEMCSREFGLQMNAEARRRRFREAVRRVFIGDVLAWNWSVWKEHFRSFTPILDFIQAVQYLYAAADAYAYTAETRWSYYLAFTEAVWQGRVGEVIDTLKKELLARGVTDDEDLAEDDPQRALADAGRLGQFANP